MGIGTMADVSYDPEKRDVGSEPRYDQLFIYQMGKVASTAVCRSLDRLNERREHPFAYLHCHYLDPDIWSFMEWLYGSSAYDTDFSVIFGLYRDQKETLRRWRAGEARIGIMTGVREPVSRIVSAYFHGMEFFAPHVEARYGRVTEATVEEHLRWLFDTSASLGPLAPRAMQADGIDKDVALMRSVIDSTLTWFDTELLPYCGIDIYETPMPEEGILRKGDLLAIKFETMVRGVDDVIGDFIGDARFRMVRDNVGEVKATGAIYKAVRQRLRLPENVLDPLYASRYMRHFYSPDEIAAAWKRWGDESQSAPETLL